MNKEKNITSFSDADGNSFILDAATRNIMAVIDRHGFLTNSEGKRLFNVHGHKFIKGYNY